MNTGGDPREHGEVSSGPDSTAGPSPTPDTSQPHLSEKNAMPAPDIDQGLLAWSQVLAGHLVAFVSWGYITSYGLFQAYYTQLLDESPSAISWVGSTQIFLVFFLSTFSTHALSAGWYRPTLAAGLALQIVGIFATAECATYWQFFLAQSLCQGIGMGLTFAPTVGLVSSYFVKRRAVAIAGMASGMSTGGVVFPLIARQELIPVGFKWTMRTMGFVAVFFSLLVLVLVRPRPKPTTGARHLIDRTAFVDRVFVLFSVGMILAVLGMYFGYYYTTSFARDVLNADSQTSLSLLLVLNTVGLPGRLIPAWIADRFLGPTNTLVCILLISGLLTMCWAGVSTLSAHWAWVVFYGFFGASVQSLFPPALGTLTPDHAKVGIRVGMMFSIISVGCLCGAPIAGALIQSDGGRYLRAQMVVGSVMILGAGVLVASRISHTGLRMKSKC